MIPSVVAPGRLIRQCLIYLEVCSDGH